MPREVVNKSNGYALSISRYNTCTRWIVYFKSFFFSHSLQSYSTNRLVAGRSPATESFFAFVVAPLDSKQSKILIHTLPRLGNSILAVLIAVWPTTGEGSSSPSLSSSSLSRLAICLDRYTDRDRQINRQRVTSDRRWLVIMPWVRLRWRSGAYGAFSLGTPWSITSLWRRVAPGAWIVCASVTCRCGCRWPGSRDKATSEPCVCGSGAICWWPVCRKLDTSRGQDCPATLRTSRGRTDPPARSASYLQNVTRHTLLLPNHTHIRMHNTFVCLDFMGDGGARVVFWNWG